MSTLNAGQEDWLGAGMPEPGEGADSHVLDDAAGAGRLKKAPHAFRTISEVADELHVPQHVLRFWETRFNQVRPLKRGGGRRYYRPDDIELLRRISDLLYVQGYTIKGVQRMLREGDEAGAPNAASPAGGVEEADPFPDESPASVEATVAEAPMVEPPVIEPPVIESPVIETSVAEAAVVAESAVELPVVEAMPAAPELAEAELAETQPAEAQPAEAGPVIESVIESVTVVTVEDESPAPAPAIPDEEKAAEALEIARIYRENLILKDSLRGILVELQALRQLIPV